MTDKRPSWAPTAMIFPCYMLFNVVDKVVDVVVDVEFIQPSDVFQDRRSWFIWRMFNNYSKCYVISVEVNEM